MSASNHDMYKLASEQIQFFKDNGCLILRQAYGPDEMREMRDRFNKLITETDGRPKNLSYAFMESVEGYETDPYNPKNIVGMMDQPLAGDYWFDQFTDPRVVVPMADLLGPNIDFHNGKVRNKPPGFYCSQGWHQDWPYERHSHPDLAAAITYLDDTDFEKGATEVVPGSHLKGEWKTHDGHTVADEDVSEGSWEVLSAKAGDIAIIHVLVLHRAGHNYTNTARHTIINEYKTAETVDQWNNRCAFAGLPLARGGYPVLPRISRQTE